MGRTLHLFVSELRQAARRLRSAPGFATLAVGILAAGVGTNAAMAALVDALLLRPPFHVADPDHVVRVQFRPDGEPTATIGRTHYPAFDDLRTTAGFEAIAAYTQVSVSLGAGEHAQLVNALLVSDDFFHVLRTHPYFGSFAGSEHGGWAVISYGLWRRQFGADRHAIGGTISIDGQPYTIVGVTPNGFTSLSARAIDVWLPLVHSPISSSVPRDWRAQRERGWLSIVARLRDGNRHGVEARATSILRSRQPPGDDEEFPGAVVLTSIVPGRDTALPREYQVSFWLAGVSALLLLISCANVSNLVLTRALGHRREHFIRIALGAARRDLVLRHVADTCVIVLPGAAGALVVSFLLRGTLAAFLPGDVPISRDIWDGRTAAMVTASAAIAFVAVLSVSLLSLRSAERGVSARRVHGGTRRTLLAAQAGVSLALVFVAGLFVTSLRRAEALDLGADVGRTIQLTLNLAPQHRLPGEAHAIYERALEILRQQPDVERATLAAGSPFTSGTAVGPRTAERSFQDLWANRAEPAYRSVVGADFFATVGARSLRGRDFSENDRAGAPRVAIINAPLARYLWPSRDALGECIWLDDETSCVRVVGVIGGVWKMRVLDRERMAVYLPLTQVPNAVAGAIYLRPRTDPGAFMTRALSLVQNVRPDLPAARGVVLRDLVDPEFRPWRMGTTVFSAFAIVAVLITAIGLYGVVAAGVSGRLKEIGIRIALGARWTHVATVVVRESVVSVACGLAAGGALAAVASRWLTRVLYQTSPGDPVVLLQTALVLLLASALAVAAPVIRALRTDPTTVLRHL